MVPHFRFWRSSVRLAAAAALAAAPMVCLATPPGFSPSEEPEIAPASPQVPQRRGALRVVFDEPPAEAVLYHNGKRVLMEWQSVWKPVCSSDVSRLATEDLAQIARNHMAQFASAKPEELTIVDSGVRGAGINIVFVIAGSVPPAAISALAAVEAYLEAQFADPITVTVNVSFQPLGAGILGGTSSTYGYTSYTTSRAGLVNNRDASDTIQTWLPTGSTIPVRYNGASSTVTNEDRVFWTLANFNATVGAVSGVAANMTYSTNFTWDYDPSNGISPGTFSFQDVVVHEVGHALGFTSGADFRTADLEVLDLFRFQYTDGSGDYNPDTLAEFQARPRLVDYNVPNDAHICDLISAEYRMSDGSPYQASHFREQTSPYIGLMDPAFTYGETHWPNFFQAADLNMFDAIGYDR